LSFFTQRHDVLSVVTVVDRSHDLEQRKHIGPFDIVPGRVAKYRRESVAMMIVEVRWSGVIWHERSFGLPYGTSTTTTGRFATRGLVAERTD
jgi:hypothetical protein